MRLLLALVAVQAVLSTTEVTPSYELHDRTLPNSPIVTPAPANEAECLSRAAANVGRWQCVTRRNFVTTSTCNPTPPEMPVVVDTEGRMVLPGLYVEALPDGSWGPTMEDGYVHSPTWPSGPQCWVMGKVPYTGSWHAPEGPPVQEPVNWPPVP